jgi:phospholipase/carboxylesterase
VPPASGGPARQLVVLLHGYGADGNDLIELAPYWRRLLPEAAFVAPHAPERIPGMPFGFQWFSLSRYDPEMMRRDPARASDTYREMREGAEGVAPALDAFLDAELARQGVGGDGLVLVGFSQGTMMALHVGLRRRRPPACIVGFSGALIGADRLPSEATGRPPVLLVHGDADEIVPVEALFAAVHGLGAAGLAAQWHISPGQGHTIDEEGLDLAGRFIADAIRGRN